MYAVWRACERLGLKPPGIESNWDDNDWWQEDNILSYCAGREMEEMQLIEAQAGMK